MEATLDLAPITVTVPLQISPERLCDLVTTAFEGGSTHWMQRADYEGSNPVETGERVVWWGRKALYRTGFAMRVFYDDPDLPEGNGKGNKLISFEELKSGLVLLATQYPHHFADFLSENEDADTADCFMQLVVLGDVVYG